MSANPAADRNLLFGILALQMDFIARDQLVAGMNAWVLEKAKPLGQILIEQGALDADNRAWLDAGVERHLAKHNNDPQQSLAAVQASPWLEQQIQSICHPDLQASLAHLTPLSSLGREVGGEGRSQGNDDSNLTRSFSVGQSSSAGTRFRIVRPHAEGGLGKVSVALDEELKREVALKEIKEKHADDPTSRGRFLLEAEITGGLEHPGIVPVYGLGNYADGRPFYAMRFIKGDSLKEAIDRFHKKRTTDHTDSTDQSPDKSVSSVKSVVDFFGLEFRQLLGRFVDVCNAIAYAHSRGVLHRDLKPGNIMLGKYGETLVVDWGLAKAVGDKVTRRQGEKVSEANSPGHPVTLSPGQDEAPLQPSSGDCVETVAGTAVGTPAFMSPEQAAGRLDLLGPASDVYSLGATLYAILTGRPPIEKLPTPDVLRRVQNGDIPPARHVCPQVPAALEAVCRKAMALRPGDRYATPRALADDIEHCLADDPVSAYAEPWSVKAGRWVRRHQALTAGAAALLVTGVVALTLSTLLVGDALHKEQQARKERALAQVDALLIANAQAVPALLTGLEATRDDVLPRLRELWGQEDRHETRSQRGRAALALLSVEPALVKEWLAAWMIQTDDPREMLLVRDTLKPHARELRAALWECSDAAARQPQERFRALVALAAYDPDNVRWHERASAMLEQWLTANPLHIGLWVEALRPVRAVLVPRLADVFRGRVLADQKYLAATILADYAADQPAVLADLLMDADERQFAVLYPRVEEHGENCAAVLIGEIEKQVAADRKLLEAKGVIAPDDAKVKASPAGTPAMPAQRFDMKVQAERRYRLTMESEELDSFLVVQDKTGKELAFDDDSGGNLNAWLVRNAARDEIYTVFAASRKGTGAFVLTIVEMTKDDVREQLAKRQANAAVALLRMNQSAKVWPLLRHSPDPRARSYLIHRFARLGANVSVIVKRLQQESDVSVRRALILSLGPEEFGEQSWTPLGKKLAVQHLKEVYSTAADPGLHAAAEWLLRRWHEQSWLQQIDEVLARDKDEREKRLNGIRRILAAGKDQATPQWYVNEQGQTMVVIPGPVEFVLGSDPTGRQYDHELFPLHRKRIGRSYAIASKEVTVANIRRFRQDLSGVPGETADWPASVTWHEAAAYCNWLSQQEGIPEKEWCYLNVGGDHRRLAPDYLQRTGYRLPNEAEWEYACRAGAVTSRYYGETEELMERYAWSKENSQRSLKAVGNLKPNDLGLFDMLGNAGEWCQEQYDLPPGRLGSEDVEDKRAVVNINRRVLRGAYFNYERESLNSYYRFPYFPMYRATGNGFRVARTFR